MSKSLWTAIITLVLLKTLVFLSFGAIVTKQLFLKYYFATLLVLVVIKGNYMFQLSDVSLVSQTNRKKSKQPTFPQTDNILMTLKLAH